MTKVNINGKEYKNELLIDDSSICANCYQELEFGTYVFIDSDNDINCAECVGS